VEFLAVLLVPTPEAESGQALRNAQRLMQEHNVAEVGVLSGVDNAKDML